jgi:CheY-like chemotaxis protein
VAKKVRILVIEDNQADADLLNEFIEEASPDCIVISVDDGQKAIDRFLGMANGPEGAPDLVLMDLNLPKRSGHEVLEVIRSNDREVKVMIYSGSAAPSDRGMARLGKADGYLVKPMTVEEIEETVAQLREIIHALQGRGYVKWGGPRP